ncbi:MAG: hypothetical protein A2900_05160 [Candidatus Chisholmbacteria bacterium RIFCSPLOWO2_01_FULL_50_28]|nr:MAG: hypothetical protein A2900_05160 [Candidatus Chisholmbacteria bacterium RIFCSPLOWO2_01_FULL_50_28]
MLVSPSWLISPDVHGITTIVSISMPEGYRGGVKICQDAADDIREVVVRDLRENGRLSPPMRHICKEIATSDAQVHSEIDPTFTYGRGPAAGRREEIR